MNGDRTIIITGYAKLPEGTTAGAIYHVLGVGLEIDPDTHVVVSANATMASDLGRGFVTSCLLDHCLKDGIDGPMGEVQRRYWGRAKKAILAAMEDAYRQYVEFNAASAAERGELGQGGPEGSAAAPVGAGL